jgi:raffinose/stachyose/melibiose transport system substrate-binding protein
MKKKMFVPAIVAFAVTVALLTGCSGKKSGDAETVKLVYWSMWNQTEPQAQALEEGIRDFEKQNPAIKVEINWNGREIRKTLQPALDNKQTIDIWDEDLERVIKTWGNYALKLDPYLENTYPTTGGAAYKNAVMGSLIDLAKFYASDGGVYAVPYQPFVFAFMYNKDHFKQAGIASTPTTWAELVSAMGKLKTAGFVPMTMDDAYMDTLPGYYLARAKGYQWVEQLVSDSSNALWDDPAEIGRAHV